MSILKGLIIKELVSVKSYTKNIVLFVILAAIMSFFMDNINNFIPVYIPLVLGMMATNSFVYDGQANSERYFLAMPLNKNDIIKAKYLYISLVTFLGSVFGVILAILLQCLKEVSLLNIGDILSTGIGALFALMILQIFQIPILVKFGYEKGKFIQMIAIILIMGIASGISLFFVNNQSFEINKVLDILKKYGIYIGLLSSVVLYTMSYYISCVIYNKKEI